ncbi:stress responsive alpha-beta barrel domain protein [Striga asiatica]|uniref:Stress responsive alpha-beta barrel domain protein n=1 Tax=Striga asiatica TaxID=4170 RepID=A0A5A7Q5R3_STRAF|nr:stress responsive alpha-beta barrel domain protein [Striga asiatica]
MDSSAVALAPTADDASPHQTPPLIIQIEILARRRINSPHHSSPHKGTLEHILLLTRYPNRHVPKSDIGDGNLLTPLDSNGHTDIFAVHRLSVFTTIPTRTPSNVRLRYVISETYPPLPGAVLIRTARLDPHTGASVGNAVLVPPALDCDTIVPNAYVAVLNHHVLA